jgi:hypothetical protein
MTTTCYFEEQRWFTPGVFFYISGPPRAATRTTPADFRGIHDGRNPPQRLRRPHPSVGPSASPVPDLPTHGQETGLQGRGARELNRQAAAKLVTRDVRRRTKRAVPPFDELRALCPRPAGTDPSGICLYGYTTNLRRRNVSPSLGKIHPQNWENACSRSTIRLHDDLGLSLASWFRTVAMGRTCTWIRPVSRWSFPTGGPRWRF